MIRFPVTKNLEIVRGLVLDMHSDFLAQVKDEVSVNVKLILVFITAYFIRLAWIFPIFQKIFLTP